MNSDSLNMVSSLGEGHMPCTFFLSEPQLKPTVNQVYQDCRKESFKYDNNTLQEGRKFFQSRYKYLVKFTV